MFIHVYKYNNYAITDYTSACASASIIISISISISCSCSCRINDEVVGRLTS